jgi:hypothetical protein
MPDLTAVLSGLNAGKILPAPVDLPTSATLTNNGSSIQAAGNVAQKAVSSAAGSSTPSHVNTTDTTVSKATGTVAGSGDTSSHSAQSNGQSSQSPQAGSSQAAAATPRVTDSGASQILAQTQTAASPALPHETATSHGTPAGLDNASRSGEQQELPGSIHSDGGEAITSSGINAAKLMQTMNESEMRVGMNSTEFGEISIRTSITQQQMLAQISLNHSDLSQAISAHVASVQTKLGEEYGLHASIEVNNLGSPLSGQPGHSSQREQSSFSRSVRTESALVPAEEDSSLSLTALVSAGNGQRLDIRA